MNPKWLHTIWGTGCESVPAWPVDLYLQQSAVSFVIDSAQPLLHGTWRMTKIDANFRTMISTKQS